MNVDNYLSNDTAERNLLICLFINPREIYSISGMIPKEAFYNDIYCKIYGCILSVSQSNKNFDYNDIVKSFACQYGNGKEVESLVTSMMSEVVDFNFHTAIEQVLNSYVRRRMIKLTHKFLDDIISSNNLLLLTDSYVKDIQERVTMLPTAENQQRNNLVLNESLVQEIQSNKVTSEQILTGFYNLDNLLGGIPRSHLTVLASRPSAGKTTLACNLVLNLVKDNHRVLFFSLETSTRHIVYKFLSIETGINCISNFSHRLTQQARERVISMLYKLNSFYKSDHLSIYHDVHGLVNIVTTIRQRYAKGSFDTVVIDYLQIMARSNQQQPMYLQISDIMTTLKQICMELGITVILLSQVGRSLDNTDGQVPLLNTLSYSGAIEAAADLVIFLHRDRNYQFKHGTDSAKRTRSQNIVYLTIAKNRNGPIGEVKMFFQEDTGRFTPLMEQFDSV